MARSIISARDQATMTNPWFREALDLAQGVQPPRGHGRDNPGYGHVTPQTSPAAEDAPWMANDWRGATDGGAFHSSVRPPMPSDVPHPSEAGLHPKRNAALIANAAASEDPINDPYGVLNGTGHTFEDLVNNHVSHHQNQTPDQDYAGRVWYRAAHDLTKDVAQKTHGDHSRTVSTFSAFSPRKAWDENIEHGTHFAANYRGQDPDYKDYQAKGIKRGQTPNFTMPTLDDQVEKAKAIYHGEDPKNVLGGPKTKAFYSNIMDPADFRAPRPGVKDDAGYYDHPVNPHSGQADWRMHPDQASTVDTHHARLQTTPHGADLSNAVYATPEHFEKFNDLSIGGKRHDLAYDLHSRASWEATRRINEAQQDEGRHQTPKQTQAGPWGKFKADVDAAGRGAGSVAPGERPKGLMQEFDKKKNQGRDPQEVEHAWGQAHPLNNPIPRYQKDPSEWQDPRRPDVAPQSDWQHNRKLPPRQTASVRLALVYGGVWDKHLANWIAQHPREQNVGHDPDVLDTAQAHLGAYEDFNGTMRTQAHLESHSHLSSVQDTLSWVDSLLT